MKRNKNVRLLTGLLALTALLTFSCSDVDEAIKSPAYSEKSSEKAILSISVDTKTSRTALPEIQAEDFTTLTLKGKSSSSDEFVTLYSWTGEGEKSAYQLMQNSIVEISVGKWDLLLSGEKNGSEYEKLLENLEFSAGKSNELSFVLELAKIGESEKKGSLSINVELASDSTVYFTATLKRIISETEVEIGEIEKGQLTGGKAAYEKTELAAGSYELKILFFADEACSLLIGRVPETIHIIGGSKSSSTVKLASLDGSYAITYMAGENKIEELKPASYTRLREVTLPVAKDVEKEGSVFCGWYADSLFSGSPVLSIPEKTVGDKTFYGKFMSLKDVTPIKCLEIEGTNKVGANLTAIPYTSESPSEEEKFIGEIAGYQWYLGEDSNGDSEISDSEWTAISSAEDKNYGKTASYKLLPADAGKKIKVEVWQKYTVTFDEKNGIYNVISENQPVSSAVENVSEGEFSEDSVLLFLDGLDFTYNDKQPVIAGTALDNKKLSVNPSEKGEVKDIFGNTVTVTISLPEGAVAPSSTQLVDLIVTSPGYESYKLPDSDESGCAKVRVYIKARTPGSEGGEAIPALLAENADDPQITFGYVKFAEVNSKLEYTLEADSEDSSKAAKNAVWHPVNTVEFKNGTNSFVDGEKIFIREKAYESGLISIEPSDFTVITVAAENIGKRNAVKVISVEVAKLSNISLVSDSNQAGTIKITADLIEGASYVWESENKILGYEYNPFTFTETNSNVLTLTYSDTAIPGRYGITVSVKNPESNVTYSNTIYVTLGNN